MEQSNSLFGLSVDAPAREHLSETARWGRFLAIVGFIMCGLVLIGGIFMATLMNRVSSMEDELGARGAAASKISASLAMFFYILFALLYFFPCLYLYRFSQSLRTALNGNGQEELNNAFFNLKRMFRYVGILTVIILCIYALAIIIAILGYAMRG